ncbi:hypothetical protein Vretimale_17607 [Volvox reticuliferus]|uniref:Uncharacterized protein n=1 Tax=Volvox reticuliferus TaxID=1737510 RepID=A0A8J4GWH1_9CHLO|nr:hypothetical protein Vretimale_17607 [Volvox reticuliferus]
MCSRQRYADGGDSLERLRREAETEMRRVLDESRPRKRPRDTGMYICYPVFPRPPSMVGDEDGLLAPIDRYRYAVVQELEAGAKGFIVTCNFQREKSATREASQLLRRYLPEHIFPTPLESDGGRVHTPGPSGQARSGSGSGLPCYGKAVAVSSAKGPDGSQQLDDTATAAATQIAAGASVKRVRQASASGGGSAGGGGHVGGSTGESCDGEDDSSDGDGKGHNGDPGELLGLGKVEGRDGGGSAGGGNDAPEQGEGLQCGSRGGAGAWAEGAADREGGDRELPALGLAKVGCRGVVLIRLSAAAAAEIDPVAVVDSMLADLKTGSLKPPR